MRFINKESEHYYILFLLNIYKYYEMKFKRILNEQTVLKLIRVNEKVIYNHKKI